LQKQLKGVVNENFEFRNTRNGTTVITRSMGDFLSVKSHVDLRELSYYSFSPKSEKPIKAVTCQLPHNTPAEDISDGLVSLVFGVVSVKQTTATRRSTPEEAEIINRTLFHVTLPRRQSPRKFSICQASATLLSEWRLIEPRMLFHRATTASSSTMSGLIANNLPALCGAGDYTCKRTAQRRETLLPHQHAVTASWLRNSRLIPPNTEDAGLRRSSYTCRSHREHPRLKREGVSP
jgi:hypothetical protein